MKRERIGVRSGQLLAFISAVALAVLSPMTANADADADVYLTPSLSVGRIYDDNLFSSATDAESDAIWRLSPALEAGYDSKRLLLAGYYSFDAENYARHPELNSNVARQYAALDLRYQAAGRLQLSMQGNYVNTDTPEQLSPNIGLGLGHVRAKAFTLNPALAFEFDPVTTGTASYTVNDARLENGPDTDVRTAALGLKRAVSERTTFSLGFTSDSYDFGGTGTGPSRALTLGWSHTLNPRTRISVAAGPRDTEGDIAPEIAASLQYALDNGHVSCSYARTQTLVLGQTEAVNVQSFSVGFDYSPSPGFDIGISPGYVRDWNVATRADIYQFNFNMGYRISSSVSAVGSYQYSMQDGILGGTASTRIAENIVFVGLVFSFPESGGGIFTKRKTSPFETRWPVLNH